MALSSKRIQYLINRTQLKIKSLSKELDEAKKAMNSLTKEMAQAKAAEKKTKK